MRPELDGLPEDEKELINKHNALKLPYVKALPALVASKIKTLPAQAITPANLADIVGDEIRASVQPPDPDMILTQPHPGFPDLEMQVAGIEAVGAIMGAWLKNHHLPQGVEANSLTGAVNGIIASLQNNHLLPLVWRMSFTELPEQRAARVTVTTAILSIWRTRHGLPPHQKPQIPSYDSTIRDALPKTFTSHPFNY